MRSRAFAIAIATSMALTAAPVLAPPARAEMPSLSASTVVPVVLWAATGAVIGAVIWPVIAGGAVASAAPAGVMSVGSLVNAGALAGAFVGGAGYLLTR